MTIDVVLLSGGLLAVVVAALSSRLRRLPPSEPLLGLVAGIALGPAVAGVLDVRPMTEDHMRLGADPVVLAAGSLVVLASTVVHGTSAAPGRALYRRVARRGGQPG